MLYKTESRKQCGDENHRNSFFFRSWKDNIGAKKITSIKYK
jgi:hypothetical protein